MPRLRSGLGARIADQELPDDADHPLRLPARLLAHRRLLAGPTSQLERRHHARSRSVKCNKALAIPKVQLMTDAAASRTGLAFNLAVNDGGGILNPGGIARPAIKPRSSPCPRA